MTLTMSATVGFLSFVKSARRVFVLANMDTVMIARTLVISTDYDHIRWTEAIIKNIDEETDSSKKAEIVLRARDEFMYLKPTEKADVFIFLLGKNRGA